MQPEALEEARDWLNRAERDLLMAQRAMDGIPVLADQCAFHAQQAAEKALKAYLVAMALPLPKSHNLIRLVTLCQAIDDDFGQLQPKAQLLNPYATLFRYPGGPLEPEESEANEALRTATQIVDQIRHHLPE